MKAIVVDKSKRNAEKFQTSGEYSFDIIISFALKFVNDELRRFRFISQHLQTSR
jgi:hypothetical protein